MTAQEKIAQMTDEEFVMHTTRMLSRELGLAGYARYLRLFGERSGDYTRDRHQWLGNLTFSEFLAAPLPSESGPKR